MVCFTISSIERFGAQQKAALGRTRADARVCCDRSCAGAMVLAAPSAPCSRPRCSMMLMAALERLSCSMAAIICVVRLVVGGHSASAARRAARDAVGAPWVLQCGRFVKPLPCAFPTLADSLMGTVLRTIYKRAGSVSDRQTDSFSGPVPGTPHRLYGRFRRRATPQLTRRLNR